MANNAEKIRDIYKDVRQRLFDNKKCRESKVQRLAVEANVSGYIGIAYQFCNTSQEPIENVCVNINVIGYHNGTQIDVPLNVSVVPTTSEKTATCTGLNLKKVTPTLVTLADNTLQITETWDKVDACSAASFLTMLKVDGALDGCSCNFRDGDSIKVVATTCDGSKSVSQTIEVKGNGDCGTEKCKYQLACKCDPCPPPIKTIAFDPEKRPSWGVTIMHNGERYLPQASSMTLCEPPADISWSPDDCPDCGEINLCE